MAPAAQQSAAERAEARRKRILEKSKKRLAYASGLTTDRPSNVAPDTPPTSPSPSASSKGDFDRLLDLSLTNHERNRLWELTEGWRVFLIGMIAIIVGVLGVLGYKMRLSAVEVFTVVQVVLNAGSIGNFLSRETRQQRGLLRTVMNVVSGFKLLRFLLRDFIVFTFLWMWAVRVTQIIQEAEYI